MLEELKTKEKRIDELGSITNQITDIENKLNELKCINETNNHKDNLRVIFTMKELEKQKLISSYVKDNNLWNKLSKNQKHFLIKKYIDTIEIDFDEDRNVIIKNINISKKELENIGYMFRNDCFDMIVNIDEKDVITSNYKTSNEIDKYVRELSKYYKVNKINIDKELLDLSTLKNSNTIQVIPIKKDHRFEKDKYTILQIGA